MSGIVRRPVEEVGGNRKLGQLGVLLGLVTNTAHCFFTGVSCNSKWSLQTLTQEGFSVKTNRANDYSLL